MTLTEFLLANIQADEDAISHWTHCPRGRGCTCTGNLRAMNDQAFARCEAYRGIIDAAWADHLIIEALPPWHRERCEAVGSYPEALRHLAVIYSVRPGYQTQWRPS